MILSFFVTKCEMVGTKSSKNMMFSHLEIIYLVENIFAMLLMFNTNPSEKIVLFGAKREVCISIRSIKKYIKTNL